MKRLITYLTIALFTFTFYLTNAQSTSATFSTGNISSEFVAGFPGPTTANNSTCPGNLTVNVPVGVLVTGVDVEYDYEATGFNFMNEQASYLECVTTNLKESAISVGTGGFAGTQSYNRTGLNMANGIAPAGGIQFRLHAFRTFGGFPLCAATGQRVLNNTFKVTVHHVPAPSCPPPSLVTVSNIQATSATIDWTSGGATNWQIEYGAPGFTPGTGTLVGVTAKPYTLTNLTANTSYDVYVRDSCGVNDVSFWSNSTNFTTTCTNESTPYFENFDGSNFTASNGGFNDPGVIDQCWARNTTTQFHWRVGTGGTTSFGTGPSGDHTNGSGNYMFTESFGTSIVPILTSPNIDLSNLTSPEMNFWYHMFGPAIQSLQVEVRNISTSTWTNIATINGAQQNANNDPWEEQIISLASYANQIIQIRFRGNKVGFGVQSDIAIDDFGIYEAPTCPKPSALSSTANSNNSVTITWTTGGATDWQIEYGPTGFTPGNGTLIGTSTNPTTINNLNPSTAYDFYVRDSCGVNDVSFWTGPLTASTACAVTSAPYTENFDNSNWNRGPFFNSFGTLDTCWSRTPLGNLVMKSGPPIFVGGSGAQFDHTTGTASGKYVFSENIGFSFTADTARIISPPIDLTPLTVPEMSFWYHAFGFNIEDYDVYVSSDGGANYNNVFSKTGQEQQTNADPWTEVIVNLAAYANDTVIVKFEVIQVNFGGNGNVCFDDFSIKEAPTCPKPQNLDLDFVWIDNATFSWTTGGAADWQLQYGAPGFALGSGTIVNTSSNPENISGLTANTQYDIYVRDSCAPGDVSVWVGPFTFRTLCNPFSTPYTEDFEGSTFGPGPNFNDTGFIDNCWSRTPVSSYVWKGGPPPFLPFNTGPNVDHTLGTAAGGYVFSETIGFGAGALTAEIVSPPIDLSSLTNPQLTFWCHMFGNAISSLKTYVDDGSGTWVLLNTQSGQQQNAKADAWKEVVVSLSAYVNDTVRVKFEADKTANNTAGDISLDDVNIDNAPNCPKPQDLAIVSKTNSTVTLSWTSGGASQWNIEYGSPGFTAGTGTYVVANSNPFTITNLTPNTGYEFYVRDSCGTNDVSIWVGPVGDTTDCNPVSAPYVENFDGTNFTIAPPFGNNLGNIDQCWDREEGTNYGWTAETASPNFGTGPSADNTSGSGKFLYSDALFGFGLTQTTNTWVTTVLVDLTPLTIPELTFWYHMFGNNIDSLIVDISDGQSWTTELILSGQQQNAQTDAWKEAVVDISSYANDTIKVRFRAARNTAFGFQSNVAIDDVDIHEQPTCPKPSNLTVNSTGANSITLGWTSGGATNWQIEYGPSGFIQGGGTVVQVTTNPFTVNNLTPSTTYDFYVRDSCGATDKSDWLGAATAATLCLPVPAPWAENFDGAGWLPGAGFGDTGTIANCWDRNPVANYFWAPGPPAFQTFNTGPDVDHTTGSATGGYAYTESGFLGFPPPTAPFTATLETPSIDLSPLTVPELSFWYHMFGGGIGDLDVEIDNGSGYTNLQTITGQQQTSGAAAWLESIIDLSAYAGDTIRLRFTGTRPTFNQQADVAVDDVDIHEKPSCPKPSALTINSSTVSSVTLGWTTGGATNWQIEYGPLGFTSGTGTIVQATTNPFTVPGLNGSTSYDFYVRDSCGASDLSDWTGPIVGTTQCAPIPAPWVENFDGSNFVPGAGFADTGTIANCWSRNPLANYFWTPGPPAFPSFNTGPDVDHTTGSATGGYVYAESAFGFPPATPPLSAIIETPIIDLSPLTVPELSFWYHMFGVSIGDLEVEIDNGTGYTSLQTITGQQQNSGADAWLESIINLSAYAGDTVRLRFTATKPTTGIQADVAVDDIDIHEQPACPKPQMLTVTGQSSNSVTLSWTTGGATDWQIEYGAPGFSLGSGTIINVTSNPFTVTSLTAQTDYQFYVRDSCGVNDVSPWLGPVSATTDCAPFVAPYTENFDGSTFVFAAFGNDPGQIDPCWNRNVTTGYYWKTGQGPTFSGATGPDVDHTTGTATGKYMFAETFGAFSTTQPILTSPNVDLTALTTPELRFWYHMFGASITSLTVEVWDGATWTSVQTITPPQQTANADPWTEQIVGLSAYANDTIKVRFTAAKTGGFASDVAIDDFWIGEAPTCPQPSNIIVSNPTDSSIDLSWTSGGASNWNIRYRQAGLGGPFTVVSTTSNPFTLTGLSASKSYEIYVQDSCGMNDVSMWVGPVNASTSCGVVAAPYFENFDNGSNWSEGTPLFNDNDQIDQCWSRPTNIGKKWGAGSGTTFSGAGGTTGPLTDVSGSGNYIYLEGSGGGGTFEITSPQIEIGANMVLPKLYFNYFMFGPTITSLAVQINDGSGWSANLLTITGQQQTSQNAAWIRDSVDLANYLGDTIQFKFIGIDGAGFTDDIAVDEIEINGKQCPEPSSLVFSSITQLSANVNWFTLNSQSQLMYQDLAQTQPVVFVPNATVPYTMNGLSPNTSYLVSVRDSCSQGNVSAYIVDTVTTLACPAVVSAFTAIPSVLNINLDASTSVNADTLTWDFGDGSPTVTGVVAPLHAYAAPGTYTVQLIATNFCGSRDTTSKTFTVCDSLKGDFVFTEIAGDTIQFDATGLSSGVTYFDWDFGDGNSDTLPLTNHYYTSAGNYNVTLTVSNLCGDTISVTKAIQICLDPVASWTYNVISTGVNGMQVQFDASATQNAISFDWDFGDGNTNNTSALPVHTYSVPGLFYLVTLTVENACGDQDVLAFRLNEISIDENSFSNSISIYPNPATDFVKMEWNSNVLEISKVSIYDMSGKKIHTQELNVPRQEKVELELNTTDYSEGVYLLELESSTGTIREQIIIR